MVMLVITRWYGSRCYWQKLTITSALQTWWSSWGQKRRRMVHQSNAAFVDAKGVSGWEKQTQLQGESSMDENDDRIMCFFPDLWWSLMIFANLIGLMLWESLDVGFVAFGSLFANQLFAVMGSCVFTWFYLGIMDKIVCPHLDCDAKRRYKQPNTFEYSRKLKVATADRFQVGTFWSRHCARQTVFKCPSEDCYFHACQDWTELLGAVFGLASWGHTRSACRRQRLKAKADGFLASFGVEMSNLENWNQLGTRETLNPPKSSIPYAKVVSLWFSR